jgi:hypothetical protein
MINELLNKNQIKEKLNISIGKLNGMMRKNEIPFIKIGKCVRFDLENVVKTIIRKS